MARCLPNDSRPLDLRDSVHRGSRLEVLLGCLDDKHLMLGAMSDPELRGMQIEFSRLGDTEFRQVCVLLKNRLATLTLNDELMEILSREAHTKVRDRKVPLRMPSTNAHLPSTMDSHQTSLAELHERMEHRCHQLTQMLTKEHLRRFSREPAPFVDEEGRLFHQRVSRCSAEELHMLLGIQRGIQGNMTNLFSDAEFTSRRAKDPELHASMTLSERQAAILEAAIQAKEGHRHNHAQN